MTAQTLRVEVCEPLPGKYLANCSLCRWELWSSADRDAADAVLRDAFATHVRTRHGDGVARARTTAGGGTADA